MKDKKIIKLELFSLFLTAILGTLLHFTFEWSNNNLFIGSFSAVNESLWEHLKLIFFPTLITIIIGAYYNKDNYSKYIISKTRGLFYSLIFIVIFFYTY